MSLEKVQRSSSEQLNIGVTRTPSAPQRQTEHQRATSKPINLVGLSELRRRRLQSRNMEAFETSNSISPQKRLRRSSNPLNSPRQIMCVGNYDLGRTIGRGQFGKVKIATHVLTGETVAVKIIRKCNIGADALAMVRKEIDILKKLNHPHIIKLYEVLETDRVIFIIQELASGGEALDFVVQHGKLGEDRARIFFRQIVSAISYCHNRNIAHRDLKAENLLLDEELNIKVIDFNLSTIFKPGELLTEMCGSPKYVAPEIMLKQPYDGPKIDIWSLGVVLFVFVVGVVPFRGKGLVELFKLVTHGKYEVPEYLSEDCKSLIRSMLCVDTEQRATMEKIKTHPWVVGSDNWMCKEIPLPKPVKLDDGIVAEMELFGFSRKSIEESLHENSFNPATATFNLLQYRKDRESDALYGPVSARRTESDNSEYLSGIVSMPTSTTSSPMSHSPLARSPTDFECKNTAAQKFAGLPKASPRVKLVRVASQHVRRGRSNTGDLVLVPQPRFPKRKRSQSDKKSDEMAEDEEELERSCSPKEKSKSGLRYQLSPRGGATPKEETEESEASPQLIRESKRKPALRKTCSANLAQSPSPTRTKVITKPVTKPLWSECNSNSPGETDLRSGKDILVQRNLTKQRRRTLHLQKEDIKPSASWGQESTKEDTEKMSSKVFSMTKQILSKRAAERAATEDEGPRALRTPFSVTSTKDPKYILKQIQNYFSTVGIQFEPVGKFAFRGYKNKIQFEIEVCAVPCLPNIYSIRMHRVDGEWEKYRAFCEELLSNLDI